MSSKVVQMDFLAGLYDKNGPIVEQEMTFEDFQRMVAGSMRALFAKNYALEKKCNQMKQLLDEKYEDVSCVVFNMQKRLNSISEATFNNG